MRSRVLSMLGIATKSGKVVSGEFSTERAVKTRRAYLVIVSEDASQNTAKMFTDMTKFHGVPMYRFGTREELGKSVGKEFRVSLAVIDKGLAQAVEKKLLDYLTDEKTE